MNLITALDVNATGLTAQRKRVEVASSNLANSQTTRTEEGGPYRRKDVVFVEDPGLMSFSSQFETAMNSGSTGVTVGQVVVDNREPERRYLPGHPDADKEGYVAFPRVNPAEDMVDLIGASRTYGANVAAIGAVKDMIQRSLDLFR